MSGVFIQPSEFLTFAAAGACCAALYAVFWLSRHFFKPGGFFETLADLTFALSAAAVFLLCLTETTDGTLRLFYFIAYFAAFFAPLLTLNLFKDTLIALYKRAAKHGKKKEG
ncbi:MAG: hypothetical protein LBP62_05545 [Clostridiales bacterium]|jgi:hypothetical protein|nr:hypothetical protein [Clostridiales bacterium]